MAHTDIATRTYNHGWRLDPIVRSLLDTDFYKLLMLQLIWRRHRDLPVTFSMINRSRRVRLADIVDEGELRAQLDHARTLAFTNRELIWLAGNTFYGKTQIICAAIRTPKQIVDCAVAGADIVTTGLAVYQDAIKHAYTRQGIETFINAWDNTVTE